MANTLLNSSIILNESLDVFHNECSMLKNMNKQYDSSFKSYGNAGKAGTELKVRMPNKYTVRTGATISLQDTTMSTKAITCDSQTGVDLYFSSVDLTMKIEEFSKSFIQPAMKRLASDIDGKALALFKDVANQAGTPGTTPATAAVYLDSGAKLSNFATPLDSRAAVVNPNAQAGTVDGLKGLFQSSGAIASQYEKGLMGKNVLGFDFYTDQNVQRLTCGTRVGTILVDGAPSSGDTTLHVDGLTNATDTFKEGEVFTVAGVNAVNPETGEDTGDLAQFVITADATAVGNEVDLSVYPAMTTSGINKTITALPANNAAIVMMGVTNPATTAGNSYPINMAFHRDAFAIVTADLDMPKGVDFTSRGVSDGISMRIVRNYDINNDRFPCRIDILSGLTTLYPDWACRIVG